MDPSPRRSNSLTAEAFIGPGLAVLLLAAFAALPDALAERYTSAGMALLGINTAYSALSGGLWAAVTTSLLIFGYFALEWGMQAGGFTPDHLVRLATIAVACPVCTVVVLDARARAQRAARFKAERDAAIAHARQLEFEVERRLVELRQASDRQDELERFRELDRLKGMFVNAVSHELRTPLTTIVGYVEFMEDGIGGTLSPIQRDYVQQIRRSSKQLERLVDDLLDFARLEAGTFKLNLWPADLSDKTRQVANSLRPQVQDARLTLEVNAPELPVIARIDSQRIDQVLLNLLSNAIKFTPEGGTIRLRMLLEGETACWEVTDTGIGIDPSQHDKLFRPYSRLETGLGVKGTGLGLSISKAIIEAHGGAIGVDSTPGQGSTFWFRLPLQAVSQPAEPPELTPQAL